MEGLPYGSDRSWGRTQQLEQIAEAGFDGIGVFLTGGPHDRETIEAAAALGLEIEACAILPDAASLPPVVDALRDLPAIHHLTVQPNLRTSSVDRGVESLEAFQEAGKTAPFPVYFETHRGRLTEAIGFTCALLERLPDLRLTADLSHYVLGTEMRPDEATGEVGGMVDRIMERSCAYHARVASREQIQIQVEFDHHRIWLDLFTEWWTKGIAKFREESPGAASLSFTVELGPPAWYAMTDRNGDEMSDRWAEAQQIASVLRSCWKTW
jgi:hypothetical protein